MLAVLMAALLQGGASPPPQTISAGSPQWLSSPGPNDFERGYPKAAREAFLNGRADLVCRVEADGKLVQCKAENVAPEDGGFGDAALSLRGLFRLGRTGADVPLPAEVRIPLRFNLPADLRAGLVAVAHSEVTGSIIYVDCRYSERGLDNCVTGEAGRPAEVALALAKQLPLPKLPRAAGRISLPLSFAGTVVAQAGASRITAPDWLRRPSGEDLARVYPDNAMRTETEGSATTSCSVTTEGILVDCVIVEEAPGGRGFGAAAIKLMALFKMRPMTRDGVPVSGGTVRIPIRFLLPR